MTTQLSIPFTAIIEGDRARDKKKYGDLTGLASSLEAVGSINPIGLDKRKPATPAEEKLAHEGFVYQLVHGGRRYLTMKTKVKPIHLWHGSFLNPEKLGFLFSDEIPEHVRKEAELDENLHRLDMDWVDSCLLVCDIHDAKRKAAQANGKRWGERQTAALLGKGYGKSNVNYAIRIAECLRNQDADMLACSNMSDAIALMIKRKEDEALSELTRRTMPKGKPVVMSSPQGNTGTSSFLDTINITLGGPKKGGDAPCAPNMTKSSESQATNLTASALNVSASNVAVNVQPVTATEKVPIPLSSMFQLGDFRDVMNRPLSELPLYDHIVTDIPYGIDMDNLDEKQVADVKDQHDVAQNVGMMETFLLLAYASIKPGGFCVFFYDLDHHEKLQFWARVAGFKVQRWPLIAGKTSACQNNAAQYNLTKSFEVAMFLRKDEKTVLRHDPKFALNNTCVKLYDFAAERRLYNNPFAKPYELWKDIFDMISFPGQSVLDPFCGEMSSCRAAANCGLTPFGIEISEQHFNRGLEHMKKVYALIHKSNCEFV